MIIRTKQGDLIELKRSDFLNDELYYESIARAKGMVNKHMEQSNSTINDIIKKISAGNVETVPRRRGSSGHSQ